MPRCCYEKEEEQLRVKQADKVVQVQSVEEEDAAAVSDKWIKGALFSLVLDFNISTHTGQVQGAT